MSVSNEHQRALLLRVARQALSARGFEADFSTAVLAETHELKPQKEFAGAEVRDLRHLPWCSIDNDDSRDLDQLTVVESLAGGQTRLLVAVADVSELVKPDSPLDAHAAVNTTSIYTPPRNFPMLPDRLSTDLTCLVEGQDRFAVVVELLVDANFIGRSSGVYPALVHNYAKLAYPSLGAWLEGEGEMPKAVGLITGLAENLRLQDQVAQGMKDRRHEHGALELETIEVRTHFDGDDVSELVEDKRNRAKELIEDFMIAANGVIARFLKKHHFPVFRRVLRSPDRWERIVELAQTYGEELSPAPDAKSLNDFLLKRRTADPLRFADLSLSVIKLLGRGEYAVTFPDETVTGHFGLAISEYTHSTAPNRRYPDLITQRLIKAALAGRPVPYPDDQLAMLAAHCTQKEDDAHKVERLMRKAAAACLLCDRIGDQFDGFITGASEKGTWVRIFEPPVEGRVQQGYHGLDVGDKVRVKLIRTTPEQGFIDFACIGRRRVGGAEK